MKPSDWEIFKLVQRFFFFNPILQNGLSGFAEFWNLIVYLFINFFFQRKSISGEQ